MYKANATITNKPSPTETFTVVRGDYTSLGIFPDGNLIIKKVGNFGPAKVAGLTSKHEGWRILTIDGEGMRSLRQYRRRVSEKPMFKLTIRRPKLNMKDPANRQIVRRKKAAVAILNDTKLFIQDLMKLAANSHTVVLTDENYHARQLCYSIERCFMFGLRPAWYGGQVSFWKFFEAAGKISRNSQLRTEMRHILNLDGLEDNGRGRALVRVALKKSNLAEFLVAFTTDFGLCQKWYYNWSILGNLPHLKELLTIFEELVQIEAPVVCGIDDVRLLNSEPVWELDFDMIPHLKSNRKQSQKPRIPTVALPEEDETIKQQSSINRRLFERKLGKFGSDSEDSGSRSAGPSTPQADGSVSAEVQAGKLTRRYDICDQMLRDLELYTSNLIKFPGKEISDEIEDAASFCRTMEKIFLFGQRTVSSSQDKIHFFQFLEESCREYSSFAPMVEMLQKNEPLNMFGKGRAFIRLSLNQRNLLEFMQELTAEKGRRDRAYFSWAALGNDNNCDRMLKTLRGLRLIRTPFCMTVEPEALNAEHCWKLKDLIVYWFDEEIPEEEPKLPKTPREDTFFDQGPDLLPEPGQAEDNFSRASSHSYSRSYASPAADPLPDMPESMPDMPDMGSRKSVMEIVEQFQPGFYKVLTNTWSTEGIEIRSTGLRNIDVGHVVHVIDVVYNTAEDRVRGEMENGEWITLKNVDNDDMFVEPYEIKDGESYWPHQRVRKDVSLRRARAPQESGWANLFATAKSKCKPLLKGNLLNEKKDRPVLDPSMSPSTTLTSPVDVLKSLGNYHHGDAAPAVLVETKKDGHAGMLSPESVLSDVPLDDTPFTIELSSDEELSDGEELKEQSVVKEVLKEEEIVVEEIKVEELTKPEKPSEPESERRKESGEDTNPTVIFYKANDSDESYSDVDPYSPSPSPKSSSVSRLSSSSISVQDVRDIKDVNDIKFANPFDILKRTESWHTPRAAKDSQPALRAVESWHPSRGKESRPVQQPSPDFSKLAAKRKERLEKSKGAENPYDYLLRKESAASSGRGPSAEARRCSPAQASLFEKEDLATAPLADLLKAQEYDEDDSDNSFDSLIEDIDEQNRKRLQTDPSASDLDPEEDSVPPDERPTAIHNPFLAPEDIPPDQRPMAVSNPFLPPDQRAEPISNPFLPKENRTPGTNPFYTKSSSPSPHVQRGHESSKNIDRRTLSPSKGALGAPSMAKGGIRRLQSESTAYKPVRDPTRSDDFRRYASAPVDTKSKVWASFSKAVTESDYGRCLHVLKSEAINVNQCINGLLPLRIALERRSYDIASLLIEHEADLEAHDSKGSFYKYFRSLDPKIQNEVCNTLDRDFESDL